MPQLKAFAALALMVALAGCASNLPSYPVFFNPDATALTPDAQRVVVEIAHRSAAEHPSKIIVEGQADGATSQETVLAEARAGRVADALAAAGIDPARIERRPGVPAATDSGVSARKVLVTLVP
jgi:hypothetical protein